MLSRRQSGEGQVGCIFALIILLIVVFIAFKLIPVKVKAAELRQTVIDSGKSAGFYNNARIRKNIVAKAEEEGLPVTEKDIEIRRNSGSIDIRVEYTVPVEFPGFVYQWHFVHHAANPLF